MSLHGTEDRGRHAAHINSNRQKEQFVFFGVLPRDDFASLHKTTTNMQKLNKKRFNFSEHIIVYYTY